MSDKKGRYWWFRFRESFFSQPAHILLENKENGTLLILLYIKLMAMTANTGGYLRYNNIPLKAEDLSQFTRVPLDEIEMAIPIMMELGLLELSPEGFFFLPEVPELIGSETDDARKKRQQKIERENSENDQNNSEKKASKSRKMTGNNSAEKSERKSIGREYSDGESERVICIPPSHELGDFYNVHLSDDEINKLKDMYPSVWKEYVDKLSTYKEQSGKEYKSDYATILKWLKEDGAQIEF